MRRLPPCAAGLFMAALALPGAAQDPDEAAIAAVRSEAMKTYQATIDPFVRTYCFRCHGERRPKAGVTFMYALKSPATPTFRTLWKRAAASVKAHDMPPEDEEKRPSDAERRAFVEWVADLKRLSPKDPGEFVIRRLSKRELGHSLRELLGVDPRIAADLPEEVFGAGFSNSVSPLLMEKLLALAQEALNRAPAGVLRGLLDESLPPREVARTLARKAFRRPPSEAELDVLMRVYGLAAEKGRPPAEALKFMLKAVLVSPQFLFITPAGEPDPARAIVPLDDHQLASRLSYFLWAAPPDAELSAAADAGTLRDPAVLAAQARRLLADPRSRALFDGFGTQWLGLDKLAEKTFDAARFPGMTASLRGAMVEEARLFFGSVLRENRPLTDFIDADYTFLNENLGAIYGLDVKGPEWRRVPLGDPNRGGVLAMPGVLATTSFPNRTSPVNRGVWVLEQLLGEHVPPAPADVPALEKQDPGKVADLTLRQRTELHRKDPGCANCHRILDPIGFGLENFDAIGRWRDRDDSGGPIDAAGELPGDRAFRSPKELKRILAERAGDLCRNLVGRLLAYALCRQLEGYDEVVVDRLAAEAARDGFRMQTLVVAVATSYPFTHRRVKELKGPSNAK
jgi:mono/diheme cytochrome c family protein